MPWIGGMWVPDRDYEPNPREQVVGLAGRPASPAVRRQQDAYSALREATDRTPREAIGAWIAGLFGRESAPGQGPNLGGQGNVQDSGVGQFLQAGLGPGGLDPQNPYTQTRFGHLVPDIIGPSRVQGRSAIRTVPTGGALSDAYGGERPLPGWLQTYLGEANDIRERGRDPYKATGGTTAADRAEKRRKDPSDANWDGDYGAMAMLNDREAPFINAMERFRQLEWEPYQQAIDDIKGQYLDRIAQLQDELEGYQGGLAGTNAAYADYADDANRILSEAAAVEGEPIPEGTTQPIADSYAHIEGVMADTINRIGANGNEALAHEMAGQIGYMQDIITDAMQGDLDMQDRLFDLASSQATALAHMAWKDDLYNAERARVEIEMDINQAIAAKQDEIDDARAAMQDAIDKIRDSYEPQNLSMGEHWNLAMNDYLRQQGMNEFQIEQTFGLWESIQENNPQAMYDYATFKQEVIATLNQRNLMRAGLWDDVIGFLGGDDESLDGARDSLTNLLATKDIVSMIQSSPNALYDPALRALSQIVPGVEGLIDGDFNTLQDPEFASLLNVWSRRQDFEANYDRYNQVDPSMIGGEISYSPDGQYAYPVLGPNWWSGGGFGYVKADGRTHEGVDIHAVAGTPIISATSGHVVRARHNDMGGWTITIRDSAGRDHYYAHMDGPAAYKEGDYVNTGAMIGRVGRSGNAGRVAHLHYGIRDVNGNPIDPTAALRAVSTALGTSSPDAVRDVNEYWSPLKHEPV